MRKFTVQELLDHLGPEMLQVARYTAYICAAYAWLCAICAPLSDYCYWGPYKWYKLWQKCLFGVTMAAGGYGWVRIGHSMRTSREKMARFSAA